jgi:hypothetical protein
MKFLLGLVFCFLMLPSISSAGDFIDNNQTCLNGSHKSAHSFMLTNEAFLVMDAKSMEMAGLSCQDLRSYREAFNMAEIALMPAAVALRYANLPGLNGLLVTLGLSNPAVMAVTVVGAAGMSVVYIVLKRTYADCEKLEKEKFKQQILSEIERNYNIQRVSSDIPLSKIPR